MKLTKADPTNLPWVEKYRPTKLDELISHTDIINTLNKFINEDKLPHLLLYGPPGTGKTSTILACAKQLYTPQQFRSMVLELNASDDRGIGIVREQILSFASTATIGSLGYKLIILDEADAMTKDAQNALRRIIEKYTRNVRFCLVCNYLSKIIPALQSRCTKFRFAPLATGQMVPRVKHVIQSESLNVTEDGLSAVVELAQGDMRKALNVLQSASMSFDVIDETNVYLCVGHPLKSDIKNILEWMLNRDFFDANKSIADLKVNKGLALQDILTEVHNFVHRIDFPVKLRIQLLQKMADIEYRLASGASEKIQLGGFVAAFQCVREFAKESANDEKDVEPMVE